MRLGVQRQKSRQVIKMEKQIRISMADGQAPVYAQYDGQCFPQEAYIRLDEDGYVYADYSGEIGNAVPFSVWHNRDTRINIRPTTSGNALRSFMGSEEFRNLVGRYYGGLSIEWDGNNYVGKTTDDANDALAEIERQADDLECIDIFSASDWVEYATREEMEQHGGYEGYAKYLDGLNDRDQYVVGGASAIEDALKEKFQEENDD